ncbi:hypothetical protein [Dethiosulfatarculus sandiegensis]|uniref:tRNA (5-methylaminomethyl-2-thiouridylate)-methyltransferase n=1 Tax=Dethiosulfatarculus sandiegensis TaxID=1429043 RepID=A0A0D2GLL9_9BACT|nr:hypothetical protein [Dethiosulfatarculus sandiegensis]KIX15547.1 tRNA (5-methylaminomethyl-2-thiouridylate)-methyltransferase [Dethiosulfatarculus sandiegensis]
MNEPPTPKSKALGLFSGGLDSILACLVLRRAGVYVEAVTYTSPFFDAQAARASAKANRIPLNVVDISEEHLEKVVKNPRYGYGSHMNPCIDCHAFMLEKACLILEEKGFDFLFTGEVMGQRPMSQNKQSLATVAKMSGCKDKILRPLSAKLLPASPMENQGLVDREMLLDLSGRGRKPQIALAEEFGVTSYPAPAGGCLLTEPGFSNRLKDLFEHTPQVGADEIRSLKHGRHLRLSPEAKLMVGRNQAENQIMEKLPESGAVKMHAFSNPGPLGLYWGPEQGQEMDLALAIVAGYGKFKPGEKVRMFIEGKEPREVTPLHRRKVQGLLL